MGYEEIWGSRVWIKEADSVGNCQVCGHDMYAGEACTCECGKELHHSCRVQCGHCETFYCESCMIKDEDTGLYFCDTGSNKQLAQSECWQAWRENNED